MNKGYYDGFDQQAYKDSITVHEDEQSALVKYPRAGGGSFTVRVVRKPNPIGFHARLPGDRRN